jgi:hypothetical protein
MKLRMNVIDHSECRKDFPCVCDPMGVMHEAKPGFRKATILESFQTRINTLYWRVRYKIKDIL